MRRSDQRLFGQGARLKTRQELDAPDAPAPVDDALDMLQAFSAENHNGDFDYDESYGAGFDALNMSILTDSEQREREQAAQELVASGELLRSSTDHSDDDK